LPRRAARALDKAVSWKLNPELLEVGLFTEVPTRVRRALAAALQAREEDVVLANSASYGLHLIANGLELRPGDEVVVPSNDFPSDILPWIMLRNRGVGVRLIEPRDEVLTAEEVEAAITARTRVVCLSWVHSFSGRVVDLDGVGRVCRDRATWFVVNGSQGVGVRPIAVEQLPIDALVSTGFKWLCGPYGTGVCWLRPELRDALRLTKLYWLNALTVEDLAAPALDLDSVDPPSTGRLDIFGTANFFSFVPFAACLELMLELGIEQVGHYVDDLVVRLLAGVDRSRFRVVSSEGIRSSLAVVEPREESAEGLVARLTAAGVHVAHRRSGVRISPHLYNTPGEIQRLLDLL
jgi:selenocysteine lyase/cysteine desulfurase